MDVFPDYSRRHTHSEGETNSEGRSIQCKIARALFIEHFHLKKSLQSAVKATQSEEYAKGEKVEDMFKRQMLKIAPEIDRNVSLLGTGPAKQIMKVTKMLMFSCLYYAG